MVFLAHKFTYQQPKYRPHLPCMPLMMGCYNTNTTKTYKNCPLLQMIGLIIV